MVEPTNFFAGLPQIDLGDSLLKGLSAGRSIAQTRAENDERNQRDQFRSDLNNALQDGSLSALQSLQAKYPKMGAGLKSRVNELSDQQRQGEVTLMLEARNASRSGDVEALENLVDDAITAKEKSGGDSTSLQRIKEAVSNGNLKAVENGLNFGLFALMGADDFKTLAETDVATGKVEKITGQKVQSSEIMADGTVQMVMNDGTVAVKTATGKVLLGDRAQQAINAAQERANDLARQREFGKGAGRLGATAEFGAEAEGAKEAGKQAIDLAGKAIEAYNKIVSNIGNLDTVIEAIDSGADTGFLAKHFPTWNTATIELENAAKNLGLNIVSAVTFGALSESEMDLAMSTALPTSLNEEKLRDWVVRKKAAQQKLAAYLQDQARFLSRPGNTLEGWLKKRKDRPSGAPTKAGEGQDIGKGFVLKEVKP